MATKDRTALKDEFKNGNLATGERFADLIDSMKVVQEPVADPAASGTSLSFIDSISQDADGKIKATKKTLDLASAHELNPFKGWWKTGDTLPTTGFDGAYLYFKDTDQTPAVTTIFRWNGTGYADTGVEVDESNVQSFATGQAVNEVAIDGTGLANPAPNALAKAVDAKEIAFKVQDISAEEKRVDNSTLVPYILTSSLDTGSGFWTNNNGTAVANVFPTTANESTRIDVAGYSTVVFAGVVRSKISINGNQVMPTFCFLDENEVPIVDSITPYDELPSGETTAYVKEYTTAVPPDAKYFVVCRKQSGNILTPANFYCYKIKGDGVVETVRKSADVFPQSDSTNLVMSGGVVDLLSAKYSELTSDDYTTEPYALGLGGTFGINESLLHAVIPCNGGDKFYILYNGESNARLAFVTSNVSSAGAQIPLVGGTSVMSFSKKMFVVPDGTNYMLLQYYDDCRIYSISEGELPVDGGQATKSRTIHPMLRYGTFRSSNGEYDDNPNHANRRMVVTPRYVKIAEDFKVTPSITGRMSVLCYNKNLEYLGRVGNDAYNVVASTTSDVHVLSATEYVKIGFTKNINFDVLDIPPMISLEGNFDDDWDVFNVRPSDSGYHRVQVVVNVTNPTCCDAETSTVQDEPNYMVDYGVICLPETYTNNGPATRLIIYCHGAAVNYADDVSRFNSQDLDPTYWLAEGYAVMDVEGNPFNNTDEHFCIPQAMDCYLAAYKWAIEHFNIRRDGVFLGGRSMGGGMTFALIREQCPIPVIAACPNSPWSTAIGNQSSTRKNFWATHCGFDILAGYTFGNNTLSNNDKTLFYDNFDKLIKNNPVMASVIEVPKTADEKQAFVNCYASLLPDRKTLWETYRMKAKCPVKLFGCNQDETCPPDYTSGLFYRMLINGAQIAELRLYNSYKDYTGTGTTAHHYDTQDPALRATVTTRYGVEMSNVPIVYIEMLQFWRRFEQEN